MRAQWLPGLLVLLFAGGVMVADPFPTEFFRYLETTRGQASWELGRRSGLIREIRLRSQIWRGIPWEHELFLCRPQAPEIEDAVFLYIGGDYRPGDELRGLEVAQRLGAPVGLLFGVPNQPLFDRREDDLIAYTFRRYIEDGDPDWPLLFPMVRSVLSAMEALEGAMWERQGIEPRGFVLSGASKRGWTTYLSAAAAPEKVLGIAPLVFDILNMEAQIANQLAFWGRVSNRISPYVEEGLLAGRGDPRWTRLLWLVDPYTYRYRLSMPKLLILGSNDRYWPINALSLYWDGLPDPKRVLYVPNSGHSLGDEERVIGSLIAFARAAMVGLELPEVVPTVVFGPGEARLSVEVSPDPVEARLWYAESPVRDFREVLWEERLLEDDGGTFAAVIPRPASGWCAFFTEFVFETKAGRVYLSTPAYVYP